MNVKIEKSWQDALQNEFEQPYFKDLAAFIREEYTNGRIYPAPENLFAAFSYCPLPEVKVVILGQDPYHGPGQAHGLCFSVPDGIAVPPSLRNIFTEMATDLDDQRTIRSGNLEYLAQQGVFLLNTILTVQKNRAASHRDRGWENFTDTVIRTISAQNDHVVFLLWGSFAKKKVALIDQEKHHILAAPHPSPLSAYRGFFGCKHFSKANEYLQKSGRPTIKWLPPLS